MYKIRKVPLEEWKDIPGYEGLYQVSSMGRVKRFYKKSKERIRNPSIDSNGYRRLGLWKKGKEKGFNVHQLVARIFIGECPEGKEVNHKDRIRTNNTPDNLEYMTHIENCHHGAMTKLSREDVIAIRNSKETRKQLSIKYNCSVSHISTILNRKCFKWV